MIDKIIEELEEEKYAFENDTPSICYNEGIKQSIEIVKKYENDFNKLKEDIKHLSDVNSSLVRTNDKLNYELKKYDSDGWISVNDRLPPNDFKLDYSYSINVNFIDNNGLYYNGYYSFEHEVWSYGDDNWCLNVVSWKLPQPYKGE